jgi:DNA-binding transcriptional MocR family regulator
MNQVRRQQRARSAARPPAAGASPPGAPTNPEDSGSDQFVSVKTLARQWDCSRTTVSRSLEQAGVRAFYFGRGRNGSKRYLRRDVEEFLSKLETS